ncbi:cupin domain-containing protein [Bradyrhizobium prioriisuperbiae]|uniref:cupin domain-containing protein n=1 Tax=Bradyrhizobium prioriisuperbiae TaxID=2854389 RepID=UPI0028F0BF3F|nr:cupin domain-containing protein [Bradyrhizobium prioritasuperba]
MSSSPKRKTSLRGKREERSELGSSRPVPLGGGAEAAASEEIAETTASTLAAIGVRIRELRQLRGLKLQELADTSGLSPSMLSLVERGRASPSIGSLIVIASALGVAMSDLLVNGDDSEEKIVVRASEARIVETAQHVVRRLLREDRARGVSVAVNEYAPHTGSAEHPITHDGFEYGFVLEGELTVEVDGSKHVLQQGDLIAYSSRRRHKIWNHARKKVRTLWFNLDRE